MLRVRRMQRVHLGEGFHSEMHLVSDSLHLVDVSETACSDFFDHFIVSLETILIEVSRELFDPESCQ
jgi:hypothetical protein